MREHPEPQPEPMTARGEGCASTNADRKPRKSATGRSIAVARALTVACSCGRLERSGCVTVERRGGVEGGEAGHSLSEWTRHRPWTTPHSIHRRRCKWMTVEGRNRREVSGGRRADGHANTNCGRGAGAIRVVYTNRYDRAQAEGRSTYQGRPGVRSTAVWMAAGEDHGTQRDTRGPR